MRNFPIALAHVDATVADLVAFPGLALTGCPPEGLLLELEFVRRTIGMIERSERKRRQAPPGVKIAPRAFGRDRRMPITKRCRKGR